MVASFSSRGMQPCDHMPTKRPVRFLTIWGQSSVKISVGRSSSPGALQFDFCLMTLQTSFSEEGSSRAMLMSYSKRLVMAFTDEGWFNAVWKCSAHL